MRKFLTVLILLFFSVPAYSEIGKITVEMAWKNIAEADGFEVIRVDFDGEDSQNIYGAFMLSSKQQPAKKTLTDRAFDLAAKQIKQDKSSANAPALTALNKDMVEANRKQIAEAEEEGSGVVKINYEEDESPNAWVAFRSETDFTIHVTTGLMKILNTEDEIAGVMAHEIGHVKLNHYKRSKKNNIMVGLGGLLLGKGLDKLTGNLGAKVGGSLGEATKNIADEAGSKVIESTKELISGGFSREQEVEADDYGTDLIVKAGYSPFGLYNAMKAFSDNGFVTKASGFSSHPPTDKRLKRLSAKASKIDRRMKLNKLDKLR